MKKSNYTLSTTLGVTHCITDALTAFSLTYIGMHLLDANNFFLDTWLGLQISGYFLLYNFLAFFCQIFVGYFLDKIQDNDYFITLSKKMILSSFLFYIIGNLLLPVSFVLSIIFIGVGSCLFHMGSGNIAISSDTKKATHLGIFASGGVLGLSLGGFIAIFIPSLIYISYLLLFLFGWFIWNYQDYKIEVRNSLKDQENLIEKKSILSFFILFLGLILIFRSAIWTNFQLEYSSDRYILLLFALSAFCGKIVGGLLKDSKSFPDIHFISIGCLSVILIFIHSYLSPHLWLLVLGIFGLQILLSPTTIILYKILSEKRSEIIGFAFGLSLILGFLMLKL